MDQKTILIVGGGAGGLELAVRLGKQLGRKQKAKIVLVDPELTHIWKPLWHELAAGTLNNTEDEVNYLTEAYQHHFQFICARMTDIDQINKKVIVSIENSIVPQQLPYDVLVIAVGSISNDFNTPGVSKYCDFIDQPQEIEHFRHQLMLALTQRQICNSQSSEPLHLAIVGGGATGVELSAELSNAAKQILRYRCNDRNGVSSLMTVTLLEGNERILSALPLRISISVMRQLQRIGINVLTHERVSEVSELGLFTQSGKFIPATFKIWAAGIKAPNFLKNISGLETNKLNQLLVNSTLQTTKNSNIFALGDCAETPWPGRAVNVPPKAQAAQQQAILLSKSIPRYINGKAPLPFCYHERGSLIALSQFNTVGNIMGKRVGNLFIEGKIARLIYLYIYKRHQMTLYGWWKVLILTISNFLTRKVRAQLKLH